MGVSLLGRLRPIAAGAIVFSVATLASLTASGDAGIGNRFVSAMRFGADGCKTYLTGYRAYRQGVELERFFAEVNWADGALSAMLAKTVPAGDELPLYFISDEALITRLATYCQAHPLAAVSAAAMGLGGDLVNERGR